MPVRLHLCRSCRLGVRGRKAANGPDLPTARGAPMYRNGVRRLWAASAVRSSDAAAWSYDRLERLEPRTLFSLAMGFETLVNASKFPGNQSETAIAINPANTNQLFIGSNTGSFQSADHGP